MQRLILCAAALGALVVAGATRASVTVIGGGLAEACSRAAMAGKSEPRFEAPCTQSLEEEQLSPRDRAGTLVNRGVLRMRRSNWQAATKDFNQAVHIKPDLGEAYVNRGAASIGEHRYADGLTDLNRGIALGTEEPAKAYYNRALAYEGLDDLKAAYFDYQKAVELSPEWTAPKEQLVRFHVARKE
ncbi:tetratricopeptide repeat protein [Phenylobacterium sp.]|uniref:tetratricopeptide repeat protein n=1 Tax=Phenylobacterium sp. TaxID=1871053 RepID=UPI00286B21A3|nr:tetratricopeptide repeat protein [Phenylobacterium sp.]